MNTRVMVRNKKIKNTKALQKEIEQLWVSDITYIKTQNGHKLFSFSYRRLFYAN